MKYAFLLAALTVFNAFANTQAPELPVEAFASAPGIDLLSVSPDGNRLSMVQRVDDGEEPLVFVKLLDLQSGEQKFLLRSDSRSLTIRKLMWANNKQILMQASYAGYRYGYPVTETRLMIIDTESGKNRSVLTPQFLKRLSYVPQFQSNIVDLIPEDDNSFLLALDGFGQGEGVGVVKIYLNNKLPEVQVYGRKNLVDWVADRQHRPRIAIFLDETTYTIKHKLDKDGEFRDLWQFERFSNNEVWPIGFDQDPNILYVSAYLNDHKAIYRVNLSDATLKLELVKALDGEDVSEFIGYSWQDKKVYRIGGDYVVPEFQKFQSALDHALPDSFNRIVSSSHDKNRYIILSSSAVNAGSYYLYDVNSKNLHFLSNRFDSLPPEFMVAKKNVTYQARDGITINAYLSLPNGTKVGEKMPAIIFPHHWPNDSETSRFDYWTQFFANRGYAVLQMNFRGSAGYGFSFLKMGLQGWGLQMQQDVEDGTRWLIEQGIADANKICIVGSGYGGYAAMMDAIHAPDLYQCAVSYAGVSDLEYLVKMARNYTNYESVKQQIGDDFSDLSDRSPITHAKKLQVPLLLIHGTKDRQVRVAHSRDMFSALERHDKEVEYVEIDDADHQLSTNSHRQEAFKAMDSFLKQHLKGN